MSDQSEQMLRAAMKDQYRDMQAEIERLRRDYDNLLNRDTANLKRLIAANADNERLRSRLAEADALIAKGLAVVHDFLPNIGRCVLQDYQRMNEFCSEAAARTAVSAVQPERCCVDYPRCDCNSPPESEGAE